MDGHLVGGDRGDRVWLRAAGDAAIGGVGRIADSSKSPKEPPAEGVRARGRVL
jgi:hypothetical protein